MSTTHQNLNCLGNQFPNNYPGAAFWGPASAHFAASSFGIVWALLRSFERINTTSNAPIPVPCYQSGSIFREVELPEIEKVCGAHELNSVESTNCHWI